MAVHASMAGEHLSRLDSRYAARFDEGEVAAHIRDLARLTEADPVQVQVVRGEQPGRGMPVRVSITVIGFDHRGVFPLITGVLSSSGYHILTGDVFTEKAGPGAPGAVPRRRIIDAFTGTVDPADWEDGKWEEALADRLRQVFLLLEKGAEGASRARRLANELAADRLSRQPADAPAVLYPVSIEAGPSAAGTRMRVVSQDTPFFLFTFATALSLQGVSIEQVTIRTLQARVEDEFEFVDEDGSRIEDPARIDRIRLSVLLTKQFTSFLGRAPDPLAALLRFESLVRDILALPGQERWLELLSDGRVLSELAQLLGASTFLWEDFVRLQYEELLPLLAPHVSGEGFCGPASTLPSRLAQALAGAEDEEQFARRLNAFKDRETYLCDLDHILTPGSDFLTLSRRLTALAEAVLAAAADHAWAGLCRRFGQPRTVAGIPARYSILGLGKLGGAALGYASDIEILLVYSDSGTTDGPTPIANSEFFDRLVRELPRLVRAKREGIFHIDLRLRPFGAAGPLACSLTSFCTYYAPGGPAHAYERLSLVRLRAVGGDTALGQQVERLRDEMLYSAPAAVDMAELRALRARQAQEKVQPGSLNAKFSAGALVDLEYAVQALQVIHGGREPALRTPRIHEALDALASIGVLGAAEAGELASAYRFFRRLINGLRMLRGSARDLLLPAPGTDEYLHLARRMGYAPGPGSTPAGRLHLDVEAHSAGVRAFVERHFGRGSLPATGPATVADVVLSDSLPEEERLSALAARGFRDPSRAFGNLRRIAGGAERRALFARLAVLACDILVRRPDPDMALNNWERFLHAVPDPAAHLGQMLAQPMRLEVLLKLFSASQFLADALVREPALLDWISSPGVLHAPLAAAEVAAELEGRPGAAAGREAWRETVCRLRRREILRIGARDLCLGVSTQRVMAEISDLADGIVRACLARLGERPGFCVIALGKLGGRELNYSSDIDLLALRCDSCAAADAARLMDDLRADLSAHTPEGHAYRVDLRLRPYGSAGELVPSLDALSHYYRSAAGLWEVQALLKARPIAGDGELGARFLDEVQPVLRARRSRAQVAASIGRMRSQALRWSGRALPRTTDVKTGLGGIRDIEFLVQGLQLLHAADTPRVLAGGTLAGLEALGGAGILRQDLAGQLAEDYLFLRRVEHFLQIHEDRQTHSLPRDPAKLDALARQVLGGSAGAEAFLAELAGRFQRVRDAAGQLLAAGA